MDYFEILKKIEKSEALEKENQELRQKLAEQQPTVNLESAVVQAFKESVEYKTLEATAFNGFLQNKFLQEFQRSEHAKWLASAAQESFKVFEKKHNKDVKVSGQSNKGTEKKVSGPDSE